MKRITLTAAVMAILASGAGATVTSEPQRETPTKTADPQQNLNNGNATMRSGCRDYFSLKLRRTVLCDPQRVAPRAVGPKQEIEFRLEVTP